MITLHHFPKNKDKFVRLIGFFKEILDICSELNIVPVLDGSLAVFAYTANQEMNVNDVDLSCSEAEFPRVVSVLQERQINYRVRDWHVIQVLKDDLKIELGSTEYWYKDLPTDRETLQIDDCKITMLGLNSLRAFYRQAMEDRAKKNDANEKIKYEALKAKYEMLEKLM